VRRNDIDESYDAKRRVTLSGDGNDGVLGSREIA
jgi:hypothetical protein